MNSIEKYFPDLSGRQYAQFKELGDLCTALNSKIKKISRKDIEHLYIHHILYSLSIAKIISFSPGTKIMDAGTGGGFPGIPLAILFPDTDFTLVDSIAKKVQVVVKIADELGLNNVHPVRERFENLKQSYDFIIGRAVSPLPGFGNVLMDNISSERKNEIPNGILYLKGGEFGEELKKLPGKFKIYEIT